VTLPADEEVAN